MAPRDLRETRKLSISCQVVREWTRPVFEGRDPARKAPTQLPAARGSPGVELGAARAGPKMPSEWQGPTEVPHFCRSTEPIIVHPISPSLVPQTKLSANANPEVACLEPECDAHPYRGWADPRHSPSISRAILNPPRRASTMVTRSCPS